MWPLRIRPERGAEMRRTYVDRIRRPKRTVGRLEGQSRLLPDRHEKGLAWMYDFIRSSPLTWIKELELQNLSDM